MTYPTAPAEPQDNISAFRGIFHVCLATVALLWVGAVLSLLIGLKATLIAAGILLVVVCVLLRLFFWIFSDVEYAP